MHARTLVRLHCDNDQTSKRDRIRLVRRPLRVTTSAVEALTINLTSELLTTALFTAVATSMVTARAKDRQIRFVGNVATYLPRPPELFRSVVQEHRDVFLTHKLTGELTRIYQQAAFARELTPSLNEGWQPISANPELDWQQLTHVWQPLSGEFRLLLLILADKEPIRSSRQLARLLEIEGLVKSTRQGGTPCVRADGAVIVPGWLDRRADRRVPVGISIRLDCGQGFQRATLNDISASGAGLSACPSLKANTPITLELPNGRQLHGYSAWCHGGTLGMRFTVPLDEGDAVFAEILALRRTARLEFDD